MRSADRSFSVELRGPDAAEKGKHFAKPDGAVTLLTGGIDRPYAFGLTLALAAKGIHIDLIGGTELDGPEIRQLPTVRFLNFHGDPRKPVGLPKKLLRVLTVYARILRYSLSARPKIFHILWNYKLEVVDRTLLTLFYKALGKRVILTAHNVNAAARDGSESILNRLSLQCQYRLCDHIFVHTDAMKAELVSQFGIRAEAVSVIPFGVNNSVPDTELTPADAKRRLGLGTANKAILFFGRIRQYKGLHILVEAFQMLAVRDQSYRLIIAGEPKKDSFGYWQEICRSIDNHRISGQVIREVRFIRDDETEIYFKAADVVVLPYTEIFQSGVLFLAYSFGLPVIAADVGSLRDDIIEGETGYVCQPCDAQELGCEIERYFASDLYKTLDRRRMDIRRFVSRRNSWAPVSETTIRVYTDLTAPRIQHVSVP
jgi:glycosyltransferase involved in cell wall biosynthesis